MSGLRARILAGLTGALFLATPVMAQDELVPPEGADPSIVVTGRVGQSPPDERKVTRQARAITASGALRHEPLARFEDKLCPGVIGLNADAASLMIDRIRANAVQLDVRLTEDDGTCSPNFIVAFVDDGQADLQRIADNQNWLFRDLTMAERNDLLEEEGPVRVWTITQTRTRDGIPVPRSDSLFDPPQVNGWMAHSKIYTATRQDIVSVVVLFNKQGVRGKTLLQLADYATMRGLARTRPAGEDGALLDTILTLFDADAPPNQMTEFDRAYLAAVYDSIPNIPGITKVQGVNRQLRRQAQAEQREAAEARE